MKKKLLLIILIFLVSCSKDAIEPEVEVVPNKSTAKIVGYLPAYRFSQNDKIEYCKLTHLNIAFANPSSYYLN